MRKEWSHIDLVARHLLVHGRVEAIDAIYSFEEPDGTTHRVTRLARVVFNLKRQYDWEIDTHQPHRDLLATYVLVRPGRPTPRTGSLVTRWLEQANVQPPDPSPVSVAPSAPQGISEGLFEVIEEPPAPALRPSDYACSKVDTVKQAKVPCLRPLSHVFETRMDSRYVEGMCPTHGRVFGSLIQTGKPPTGWGSVAAPAPKTTKPRAYRKRKSR